MILKRLLAIIFATALAAMGGRVARAQWVPANGQGGGSITAFASIDSNIFAGTDNGIVRSTDDGRSWTSIDSGLTDSSVSSLAISDSFLFAGTTNGTFRSSNKGTSWFPSRSGIPTNANVKALATIGSNIFAGTETFGLFSSTDNGTSWKLASTDPTYYSVYALAVMGNIVFAAESNNNYSADNSMWRSKDSGKSWQRLNTGFDQAITFALAENGTTLYAATSSGLFRTTDTGASWDTAGLVNEYLLSLYAFGSTVFASSGYGGIYQSIDSGKNWRTLSSGLPKTYGYLPIASLAANGSTVLAGSNGAGIYRSTDNGSTWGSVNVGLTTGPTENAESLQSLGSNIFLANGMGICRSSDGGMTWRVDSGLSYGGKSLFFNGKFLYSGLNPGAYRSADSGASWDRMDSSLSSLEIYGWTESGSNLFAGTSGGGIFLSTDSGLTWERSNEGLSDTFVSCLASNGMNVFAGTFGHGVFHSSHNGASWSQGSGLSAIYTILVTDTKILAGSDTGFFVSENNGLDWMHSHALGASVNAFAFSGSELFAGTDSGVFMSSDSGIIWSTTDERFIMPVISLAVSDSNLFAGTNGSGVWRRPLSDFGISAVSEPQPQSTVTIRAWPNPFSQSTTIDFTARTAGYASVSIVNMLGTEVARLFSGELSPGEHQFTWNVGALPYAPTDGMYECVVRMNGRAEFLKIVELGSIH